MVRSGYVPTGHVFETDLINMVTWDITLDESLTAFVASGRFVVWGPGADIVWTESTIGKAFKLVEEG